MSTPTENARFDADLDRQTGEARLPFNELATINRLKARHTEFEQQLDDSTSEGRLNFTHHQYKIFLEKEAEKLKAIAEQDIEISASLSRAQKQLETFLKKMDSETARKELEGAHTHNATLIRAETEREKGVNRTQKAIMNFQERADSALQQKMEQIAPSAILSESDAAHLKAAGINPEHAAVENIPFPTLDWGTDTSVDTQEQQPILGLYPTPTQTPVQKVHTHPAPQQAQETPDSRFSNIRSLMSETELGDLLKEAQAAKKLAETTQMGVFQQNRPESFYTVFDQAISRTEQRINAFTFARRDDDVINFLGTHLDTLKQYRQQTEEKLKGTLEATAQATAEQTPATVQKKQPPSDPSPPPENPTSGAKEPVDEQAEWTEIPADMNETISSLQEEVQSFLSIAQKSEPEFLNTIGIHAMLDDREAALKELKELRKSGQDTNHRQDLEAYMNDTRQSIWIAHKRILAAGLTPQYESSIDRLAQEMENEQKSIPPSQSEKTSGFRSFFSGLGTLAKNVASGISDGLRSLGQTLFGNRERTFATTGFATAALAAIHITSTFNDTTHAENTPSHRHTPVQKIKTSAPPPQSALSATWQGTACGQQKDEDTSCNGKGNAAGTPPPHLHLTNL